MIFFMSKMEKMSQTFTVKKLGGKIGTVEVELTATFSDLALKVAEFYETRDLCIMMTGVVVSYELDYSTPIQTVVDTYGDTVYCLIASLCHNKQKLGSLARMLPPPIPKVEPLPQTVNEKLPSECSICLNNFEPTPDSTTKCCNNKSMCFNCLMTTQSCSFCRSTSHLSQIEIFIKTQQGKIIVIYIKPNETIWSLKTKIYEKEGIPEEQQRMIWKGKQLEDGNTLYDYQIQPKSMLHLVARLRGC